MRTAIQQPPGQTAMPRADPVSAATAAAAAARSAWRKHLAHCATCARAGHKRAADRARFYCHRGAYMRAALVDADRAADLERATPGPLPGQAELPLDLPGQATLPGMTP